MEQKAIFRISNALTIVLLLSTCATRVTQNELEPFNRQDDYNYFLPLLQDASLYSVSLNKSGFAWPMDDQKGDTVLLEFQLRESLGEDPAIRISYESNSFTQYFEEGGEGIRYLDLSPLIEADITVGERVRFNSEGALWEAGDATLAVFNNDIDLDNRTLVIAPHLSLIHI